jgi:hypothetical protein
MALNKERPNVKRKLFSGLTAVALVAISGLTPAVADSAKPGQSMTHIKTLPGITKVLESAGVILYAQGGATAGVIGDSIAADAGQVVIHVPITGTKSGVAHAGSNIVFFNTANDKSLVLRNPVIDLAAGTITATIPQADNAKVAVLTITNGADLKAKVTNDRKAKLRTTAYVGAALSLSPGVAATVASVLGLPEGALPDGLALASADVTLYGKLK